MDNLRGKAMHAEMAQEREVRPAREEASDPVEADVLRLPLAPKPRPVTDLQRWLDMCG
jgi:hypothetical protein